MKTSNTSFYDVNNFYDAMDRYVKGDFNADSQSMQRLCSVISENMIMIEGCAGDHWEREKLSLFSARIKNDFSDNAEIVKVANNISSAVTANFFNVDDNLKHVFSYLLPINELQYNWSKSNFKDIGLVSKSFYKNSKEVKLKWVQENLVSLKSCGLKTSDELVEYIITHNLKKVNVCGFSDFNETHLKKLAEQKITSLQYDSILINEWPAMETLEYLISRSANMTDTALANLAKACPNLKEFCLQCWYVDDRGVTNPVRFTDRGMIELAKACPKLKKVEFGRGITAAGLMEFIKLTPKLNEIDVTICYIQEVDLKKIKEFYPNLIIRAWGRSYQTRLKKMSVTKTDSLMG